MFIKAHESQSLLLLSPSVYGFNGYTTTRFVTLLGFRRELLREAHQKVYKRTSRE